MSPPPSKPRPPLPAGPFLVVGLARSGSAAARLLARRGERVRGVDAGRPAEAERLAEEGVEVLLNEDGTSLLEGTRTVVKSPGVPNEAPVIAAARKRGIEVLGELELAWRAIPNRFVAVTGTNGKTTTTELLGQIYRCASQPVAVAGNVGTPLASLSANLAPEATVICECSSFQLEDADAFAPECAVFLNLAPDHIDRHPTEEQYLEAKLRIFARQGNDDVAVFDADEPALRDRDLGGCARRVGYCAGADPDCEVSLADGTVFAAGETLLATSELQLAGAHNVRNAMAAAAAALAMGIDRDAVREGLLSFKGLPHRLERVAERDGVRFYNDSKATNVSAAAAALRSFDGGVHAILGGRAKGEPFEALASPVRERSRACYLIGEAAGEIEAALAATGVPLQRCANLEQAVRRAAQAAAPGETVLLAPACASFDAYRDFEQRGDAFRAAVEAL